MTDLITAECPWCEGEGGETVEDGDETHSTTCDLCGGKGTIEVRPVEKQDEDRRIGPFDFALRLRLQNVIRTEEWTVGSESDLREFICEAMNLIDDHLDTGASFGDWSMNLIRISGNPAVYHTDNGKLVERFLGSLSAEYFEATENGRDCRVSKNQTGGDSLDLMSPCSPAPTPPGELTIREFAKAKLGGTIRAVPSTRLPDGQVRSETGSEEGSQGPESGEGTDS